MPHLADPSGQLVIGPPRGAMGEKLIAMGATSIVFHRFSGIRMGVYVDNETPNRDEVAKTLHTFLPGELVVVGLYPNEDGHRIAGCVTALEWYPYHLYSPDDLPPHQEGYIVQWSYANPGDTPPTTQERNHLLNKAKAYHPRILWTY